MSGITIYFKSFIDFVKVYIPSLPLPPASHFSPTNDVQTNEVCEIYCFISVENDHKIFSYSVPSTDSGERMCTNTG